MARIDDIPKTFESKDTEQRIYARWLADGRFHADAHSDKPPYTIVIPPPNITGQLHMGHALDNTLQDILIRFKRMQGFEALWVPGTDHASIATEAKIVAAMAQEGLSKDDIGREGFLERAWLWREEYGSRIIEQLKRLGSSCDWERERFTMDEGLSAAVQEVFVRLYEKGLIYRGERIINWCPHCLTSISEAEVEYEEQDGHFWYIRYPLEDGSGSVTVATTRPETMLGDTAVAVHPDDERYADMVGKVLVLPLVGRRIPVVADTYVDRAFGTGVVKITPAHDPNDYEVGLRHKLEIVDIMTDDAHISPRGGAYAGMDRYDARKQVLEDLKREGFLVKTESHKHNVGTCYRCVTTVEPKVSLQWFVRMKPLAEPAIKAVRDGETQFVPERFDKIYFNWMENIRDWCISRQLWWGHRIPAYYCTACGETVVAREMPEHCPACGGSLKQDEDTLDTWFSSALWPFSTLGWPEPTDDLAKFYPTSVLVTAYDIIFFWVARMIFSGIEHTGVTPFHTVFIHGLIRDPSGKKMSKSLGNGVDPLEIIDQYGADALRYALVNGSAPGNDQRFQLEKIEAGRNFANKIWNAYRFVLMNLDDDMQLTDLDHAVLPDEDKWILSRLNAVSAEMTANLEKYELGIALGKIYGFVWEEFCDWYIEVAKPRLTDRDNPTRALTQTLLVTVLSTAMRLLHPFMPFLTEAVYTGLPGAGASVMIADWPTQTPGRDFPA
ncbi:MAG TPA: valine--tRNA ligase, partial [Clostridia bacterium]